MKDKTLKEKVDDLCVQFGLSDIVCKKIMDIVKESYIKGSNAEFKILRDFILRNYNIDIQNKDQ